MATVARCPKCNVIASERRNKKYPILDKSIFFCNRCKHFLITGYLAEHGYIVPQNELKTVSFEEINPSNTTATKEELKTVYDQMGHDEDIIKNQITPRGTVSQFKTLSHFKTWTEKFFSSEVQASLKITENSKEYTPDEYFAHINKILKEESNNNKENNNDTD